MILPLVLGLMMAPAVVDDTEVSHFNHVFSLRVGEEATFGDEGLAMRFERVIEDSRCPIDTRCVQEGNAAVEIRVQRESGDAAVVTLNTNDAQFASEIDVFGHGLKLVVLHPAPKSDRVPDAAAYIVQLKLEFRRYTPPEEDTTTRPVPGR